MKQIQRHSLKEKGYILLLVMLLLSSIGLYLSYSMSKQKAKIQSWQLERTTAEMTYWLDIQYNYVQDQGNLLSTAAGSNVSLLDLVNNNYLPYGQSRYVSVPSASISKVSEFMCSPLPGITSTDGLKSPTAAPTCPNSGGGVLPELHCSLDNPAYYSCSTSMSTNNTQYIANAQYYVNANYISPGNSPNILSGLGLIIRTPGSASSLVFTNTGAMGSLPANSQAQSLISMLPTTSFTTYPTNTPQVNGIGVGTYIYSPQETVKNDRYSKIIDMGLVQSVALDKLPTSCYGWTNGQKTGTGTYTQSKAPAQGTNNGKNDPPVCIRIDTTKFGPTGSVERCDRIDVLYTMFNDWQTPQDHMYWYLNYTTAKVKLNPPYEEVYLSIHIDPAIAYNSYNIPLSYLYSSNPAKRNYLAYLVRCTRNNPS